MIRLGTEHDGMQDSVGIASIVGQERRRRVSTTKGVLLCLKVEVEIESIDWM